MSKSIRNPLLVDALAPGNVALFSSATTGAGAVWDVRLLDEVSVSVHVGGNTWPTGLVVTVEVSNDGEFWQSNPTAAALTFSAEAVSVVQYVRVYAYVRVRVSTASSAGTQDVRACVNG